MNSGVQEKYSDCNIPGLAIACAYTMLELAPLDRAMPLISVSPMGKKVCITPVEQSLCPVQQFNQSQQLFVVAPDQLREVSIETDKSFPATLQIQKQINKFALSVTPQPPVASMNSSDAEGLTKPCAADSNSLAARLRCKACG